MSCSCPKKHIFIVHSLYSQVRRVKMCSGGGALSCLVPVWVACRWRERWWDRGQYWTTTTATVSNIVHQQSFVSATQMAQSPIHCCHKDLTEKSPRLHSQLLLEIYRGIWKPSKTKSRTKIERISQDPWVLGKAWNEPFFKSTIGCSYIGSTIKFYYNWYFLMGTVHLKAHFVIVLFAIIVLFPSMRSIDSCLPSFQIGSIAWAVRCSKILYGLWLLAGQSVPLKPHINKF